MHVNEASLWRRRVGARIAEGYAENENVAAVFVSGSSSRGHSDIFSDIELDVFWKRPPRKAERRAALKGSAIVFEQFNNYDRAESVWLDEFLIGNHDISRETGLLIEVANRECDFVEGVLRKLVVEHKPNDFHERLVSAVVNGVPCHGITLLEQWRSKASNYPDGLALAVINIHARIEPLGQLEVFLERGRNLLLVNEMFCRIGAQLLRVLLALNRVYYFGFKWLDLVAAQMPVAPQNLVERLRRVFSTDPLEGARELSALVAEMYQLVSAQFSQIDVDKLWRNFRRARATWEEAPLGWTGRSCLPG